MYLSGAFQLNVSCFSTRPVVFDIDNHGLVVLAGVSASLTVIFAALGVSITAAL